MRRLIAVLIVLLASSALAADAVVHPFRSQDPVVGVAVAERIAAALGGIDVLGPEVAPTLVAPVVVPGGFVNPLALLRVGPYDRSAVALMAGAIGVPVAVSGDLVFETDGIRLDLVASVEGRVHSATVRAPGVDLDVLVRRATLVVATWAGARPLPPRPLDLRGPDGDAARARALIGAGFLFEAQELLDDLADPHPTDARLRDDLRHALDATGGGDPALAAMASLGASDPAVATAAFARWSAEGGPPVSDVWAGAWSRSLDDAVAAERSFAAAAAAYPYGRAALAADLAAEDDVEAARDAIEALLETAEPAALLAASLAANALGDAHAEDRALAALGRAAPFLAYPFERRSFLAFDRDDPRTAAEVLVVAIDLDPLSDLYWTNLGWAWYLLGFVDRSEAASLRALELDPSQYIARYNLGLARVVTGRLAAALDDYRAALLFDPDVDSEAIADLVAAERDYPAAIGVAFALGFLLENAGDREAAADAYDRYLERASAAQGAGDADRTREAQARVAVLRAPLPPIEITAPPRLTLGRRGPQIDEGRPGDPLTLSFEVMTPGDALPRRLELHAQLVDRNGTVLAADEATVDVPTGAIGYVVDVLTLELPVELAPGSYTLAVTATGDGIEAATERTLVVAGRPERVRRLVGRGLVLTALESGQALVTVRDLTVAADAVWARLVAELRDAAPLAEGAMPAATMGRFNGLSGGAVFLASTDADVRDFVDYLLDSGARYATFAFVDAYAQWVLDGAP
jgi:tetratricopeptide (TPR) repeat protein